VYFNDVQLTPSQEAKIMELDLTKSSKAVKFLGAPIGTDAEEIDKIIQKKIKQ